MIGLNQSRHKDNFPNNVKCRLINPAKSNVGKISQQLLQKINSEIRVKLGLQQWRSTTDTLNWFKNLRNKTRLKFLQLDIVDFYPSITEELFNDALDFASQTVPGPKNTIFSKPEVTHKKKKNYVFALHIAF